MSNESNGSEGSANSATANDASPNANPDVRDILVGSGDGELSNVSDAGASEAAAGTAASGAVALGNEADTLALQDVLPGVDVSDPNLGAHLKFEMVDGDTVVSIDADGGGAGAAVPVVTLQDVTGVTLQDLLNSNQIIT